jgi:hypothetical protein
MLSPFALLLAFTPHRSLGSASPQSEPSSVASETSVASVTSVRCFPCPLLLALNPRRSLEALSPLIRILLRGSETPVTSFFPTENCQLALETDFLLCL